MESGPSALTDAFARKTDAELLYLTQHPHSFAPPLVEAAWAELHRRGQVPPSEPLPKPVPAPVPALHRSMALTLALALLNMLVYLLMVAAGVDAFQPSGAALVAWGSNYSSLVLAGQWWRLLTSCALHGGLWHLLLNSYALLVIGALLEPLVGRGRLLLAYVLSGLGGAAASLWWHLPAGVNSVGASGAIFGLYGFMLAFAARSSSRLSRSERSALLVHTLYMVGSSFAVANQPGIDQAAHVGGLLTGALFGSILILGGLVKKLPGITR
ncbi:rhomboid family intramembrane serine protease [Hymenobacter busanensis]|uniref:Rhomboid family intramembrane serine protease n=1 Tax=Hymenobacter busanensis TaxID=2607656 RepID=A0A7L5A0U3_9BACT|nr:rhomboid family intramembrane serine protease [Hymenobacter busanensis]KAA9338176.1 rhomboid family intramembrane serine protease [Hymenobacter busanensis]QHJ09399.1 rhomboid family intramembrane serine protease [Hymenobacter busanensis]